MSSYLSSEAQPNPDDGIQGSRITGMQVGQNFQRCPMAKGERFALHQRKYNEYVAQLQERRVQFAGTFAMVTDATDKVYLPTTRAKINKILEFHAMQIAVQVLTGADPNSRKYSLGKNGQYINNVQFNSYEKYTLTPGWIEDQLSLRESFYARNKKIIAEIQEHFTVKYTRVLTETKKDYESNSYEVPALYGWYAVELHPKKRPSDDATIGGQNIIDTMVEVESDLTKELQRLQLSRGSEQQVQVKEKQRQHIRLSQSDFVRIPIEH